MTTQDSIEQIKKLLVKKCQGHEGMIVDRFEVWQVGIRCKHFVVAAADGIYEGYYTDDSEIPDLEEEIFQVIVAAEECQEWESMGETELAQYLELLRTA